MVIGGIKPQNPLELTSRRHFPSRTHQNIFGFGKMLQPAAKHAFSSPSCVCNFLETLSGHLQGNQVRHRKTTSSMLSIRLPSKPSLSAYARSLRLLVLIQDNARAKFSFKMNHKFCNCLLKPKCKGIVGFGSFILRPKKGSHFENARRKSYIPALNKDHKSCVVFP